MWLWVFRAGIGGVIAWMLWNPQEDIILPCERNCP